jgi:hypothetical protein
VHDRPERAGERLGINGSLRSAAPARQTRGCKPASSSRCAGRPEIGASPAVPLSRQRASGMSSRCSCLRSWSCTSRLTIRTTWQPAAQRVHPAGGSQARRSGRVARVPRNNDANISWGIKRYVGAGQDVGDRPPAVSLAVMLALMRALPIFDCGALFSALDANVVTVGWAGTNSPTNCGSSRQISTHSERIIRSAEERSRDWKRAGQPPASMRCSCCAGFAERRRTSWPVRLSMWAMSGCRKRELTAGFDGT